MGHLHCNDLMIYAAGVKPDESRRRIGAVGIGTSIIDHSGSDLSVTAKFGR
jgi:hypothetical protein